MVAVAALLLLFMAIVVVVGVSSGRNDAAPAAPPSQSPPRLVDFSYLPIAKGAPSVTFAQDRQLPTEAKKALRFAFLTVEVSADLVPLQKHATDIDAVIGNWLELRSGPSGLDLHELRGRSLVTEWLRANGNPILVYPEINSVLTSNETLVLLTHKTMRRRLIARIMKYLNDHDFPGVVLDARGFPPTARRDAALLVSELEARLKAVKRKLLLLVDPAIDTRQLRVLAALADYIIAATHWENRHDGATGAPAAQGWFENRLRHFAAVVPSAKLIISIGSYCLDTDLAGRSHVISVQHGWDILARAKSRLMFGGNSLNASFTYHDDRGLPRRAWLLDGATVFNQTKAALAARPAGIALWRLGFEDPTAWASFARGLVPDSAALRAIRSPRPGYGAFRGVEGVFLTARPGHVGKRSVSYNDGLGLIVDEHMKRLPSVAQISTLTADGTNMVALTFDDGPDPRYTGRILDILARKGVKASFFDIGRQAMTSPDLVKREYLEGHDIGNHSFSHPDPRKVSAMRLAVELNATARVLRSITGARLHLFRPPYAGPDFGYLDARPEVALEATKLGYMIAGLGVETCDYCGASPSWIVDAAVAGVVNNHDHVVLLHDGGGDRTATIAALPQIIDRLRAAGYRFVTMHELVGLPRAAVMQPMPLLGIGSRIGPAVWGVLIAVLGWIGNAVPILAIATAVLGILRVSLVALMAVFQSRRRRKTPKTPAYRGPVAVLVPAYNEQPTICKTVESILASSVADRLEVIVIDDGSTDGTFETLTARFHEDGRVRAIRKENGGKASALNAGIAATTVPVVVAIDGDTVLLADAIERLTAHFADPSIGAVAGNVKVGNRIGLITAFQALEYVTSQNLDRRAFELFNAVGVVPGAIGAWRREAVIQVGGYSRDTLAEDAELTFALERRAWRVICEPGAYALTEAPETLRAFLKQRFRWMFGTLQAATKHAGSLLERPKGLALVTIPNIFLFQFAFTLLAPLMDGLLLWALLPFAVALVLGAPMPGDGNLMMIVQYWLAFQTADLSAAAVGIYLDGERGYWRLLPLVVLQRFSYRQMLYVTAIKAFSAALKGRLAGWGKLLRTGSVPSAPQSALRPPVYAGEALRRSES